MNTKTLVLCSILAFPVLLAGCATAPTPSQEALTTSGLRVATVAYITRGQTAAEQAKRAAQVLGMTALVRTYVTKQGNVVVDLDAAAAEVNVKILASTLSPADKQLAQQIVTEALFLAGDVTVVPHPTIGADNAQRLFKALGEIERAARVFAQP